MNKLPPDQYSANTDFDNVTDVNDAGIENLLREVGNRDEPGAEIAAAIRHAVHGEWQTMVTQRARRKRVVLYSVAASFAIAVVAVTLTLNFLIVPKSSAVLVASIAKAEGLVQVGNGNIWRDVAVGESLNAGNVLRSGNAARAAVNYNGLSLRVDENTTVKLLAADEVALVQGRLYVASSSANASPLDVSPAHHVPLIVDSRVGTFTHVGTQYQIADLTRTGVVLLSLREGRVAFDVAKQHGEASAGERVELNEQGEVARATLAPQDDSWNWVMRIAPTFDIDNQSLAMFLTWVGRETGRSVHYATPEVREQAEQLILRGSVGALNPQQALEAVLATTRFAHTTNSAAIEIKL